MCNYSFWDQNYNFGFTYLYRQNKFLTDASTLLERRGYINCLTYQEYNFGIIANKVHAPYQRMAGNTRKDINLPVHIHHDFANL